MLSKPDLELESAFSRNSVFLNMHKGQRCFILATGPSIQRQDLTVLSNEHCMAVGNFHLHQDIRIIAPKYHVLAPYHPPLNFSHAKKVFDNFKISYKNSEVIFFFGHRTYDYSIWNFMEQHPDYLEIIHRAHFINYSNAPLLDEHSFRDNAMWDICKKPFNIRTVICSAIQVAFYMGFSEIYLLGCDHDYLRNIGQRDSAHFYRDTDEEKAHLEALSTEWWFQEYYGRWKEYRLMKTYLEENGCRIFNATDGGMLDVFSRVDFKSLF
jgi:hypothetical protein